jgi:hypothetical protein
MPMLAYSGPSLIDGAPIVVSLTGVDTLSTNKKTGPMVQAYILRKDLDPSEAVRRKEDHSICGTCPHRNGSCYVLTFQGPKAAWTAAKQEVNDAWIDSPLRFIAAHRGLRLGAYGDPGAAPTGFWHRITNKFDFHLGYTHLWRTCDQDLRAYCMASVDTEAEAAEAQEAGWRTFRVKHSNAPILPNEVQCPNQTHGVQCNNCRLCTGTATAGKHVTANVHGAQWKQQRFQENVA